MTGSMLTRLAAAGALALSLAIAGAAHASSYVVDALANSSSGGTGVGSLNLTAGETFTVSVNPGDLWNAGPLPRWSNADGLTHDLFATGSDDSGQAAGTLIGQDFGLWTADGFSAPYGALVGEIGGVFHLLGTSFNGPAWGTGTLYLFYWDSNNYDNTQFITAQLSAVPEPLTWLMMVSGVALIGAGLRGSRRRTPGGRLRRRPAPEALCGFVPHGRAGYVGRRRLESRLGAVCDFPID